MLPSKTAHAFPEDTTPVMARKRLLDALWADGAVTVSPEAVTLKSGRQSHVYVSLRHFVCEPANLRLLGDVFGDWLAGDRPILGTVSSLLSPVLAGGFAGRFGLPLVLFRPDNAEKGLAGALFGQVIGQSILLVDDVLTSGGTAVQAAEALSRHGAAAVSLFVFVDKRPAGLRAGFPLPVAAPLSLAELLEHGRTSGRLDDQAWGRAEEELAFLAG